MLVRLAFYPSLLYNVFMEKVFSRPWYTRVDENVLLGALPFRSLTKELVENENVRGVVTLNEEYETKYFVNTKKEWADVGVEQLTLPTPDLIAAPSLTDLSRGVEFIEHVSTEGASVYVHCKAGRTRSATLVACYLVKKHNWSMTEAVEFIVKKRPHAWIRPKQQAAITDYKQMIDVAR